MAKRYGKQDYEAEGALHGLAFAGDSVPLATTPTLWRCLRCGTVHRKSLRAVKNTEKGCRCQSDIVLQDDKYRAMAKQWGIEWKPVDILPKNTKTPTTWVLKDGTTLIAPYYDLAYEGRMPNRVKKALGLPYRKRGGPVNV